MKDLINRVSFVAKLAATPFVVAFLPFVLAIVALWFVLPCLARFVAWIMPAVVELALLTALAIVDTLTIITTALAYVHAAITPARQAAPSFIVSCFAL